MKAGDLVKYSWGGSKRMALVLDFRPTLRLPAGARMARVLVQWMPGEGPIPRMYTEDDDIIGCSAPRGQHDTAVGWVPVKNMYGWDIFDKVNS